jgi:hypothetical protein
VFWALGSPSHGSDYIYYAKGYARSSPVGSRSHGLDPPRARSNLARSTPIGRLRKKGGSGGGDRSPDVASAAVLRRSRRFWPLVGLLACGLAVEHERGMGNPLVGSGKGRHQPEGKARRERRLGATNIAGVRAFRPRVVPMIYDIWRIVTRGNAWCSPRGCGGRSCGGRRRTTTTGGGRARLSRRKVMPGHPQESGSHGRARG